MAGTRTAPTVNGTPTYVNVSVKFVDSRGDKRSVSFRSDPAILPATVEALVVALQAATNASIYAVGVTEVYGSNALASNGADAVFESLFDNIAINFKDTSIGKQQTTYIPAPLGVLVGEGDVVDTANALYTAVRDAYDASLDTGYAPVTARFTERREKNDSVPAS